MRVGCVTPCPLLVQCQQLFFCWLFYLLSFFFSFLQCFYFNPDFFLSHCTFPVMLKLLAVCHLNNHQANTPLLQVDKANSVTFFQSLFLLLQSFHKCTVEHLVLKMCITLINMTSLFPFFISSKITSSFLNHLSYILLQCINK